MNFFDTWYTNNTLWVLAKQYRNGSTIEQSVGRWKEGDCQVSLYSVRWIIIVATTQGSVKWLSPLPVASMDISTLIDSDGFEASSHPSSRFQRNKMRNQLERKPERSVAAATSIKSDRPVAFQLKHAWLTRKWADTEGIDGLQQTPISPISYRRFPVCQSSRWLSALHGFYMQQVWSV